MPDWLLSGLSNSCCWTTTSSCHPAHDWCHSENDFKTLDYRERTKADLCRADHVAYTCETRHRYRCCLRLFRPSSLVDPSALRPEKPSFWPSNMRKKVLHPKLLHMKMHLRFSMFSLCDFRKLHNVLLTLSTFEREYRWKFCCFHGALCDFAWMNPASPSNTHHPPRKEHSRTHKIKNVDDLHGKREKVICRSLLYHHPFTISCLCVCRKQKLVVCGNVHVEPGMIVLKQMKEHLRLELWVASIFLSSPVVLGPPCYSETRKMAEETKSPHLRHLTFSL